MSDVTLNGKTAEVAHRELNEMIKIVHDLPNDVYEARDELEDKLDFTQENLNE